MTETSHRTPQTSAKRRLRDTLAMVLASAAVGALATAIPNRIAGRDLAGRLASTLGLGSGVLLGAVLGALTGAWLVFGGRRRVAGFMGFTCGIGAAVLLWGVAQAQMWAVGVVLDGAFGPGADQFSGLAVLLVLFLVVRLVADGVAATATKLLGRSAGGF